MKKETILFVLLLLWLNLFANDEVTTPSYPIKLPQSPNIAEFPIYGDVPVNHYTGTMSLSIPIFEIDVDGCKIPIAVNYNATGIKVAQHASNVGLGWYLDCGGMITMDCYGSNDFECWNGGYVCNSFENGIPKDADLSYYCKTNKGVDITKVDTRPDIYHYAFCGNNGDMLFPPKVLQHPILIKADKYLDITYSHDSQIWVIYDGNGNMFHLGNKPHIAMNASFFSEPTINCESYLTPEDTPSKGGYSWDYRSINAWPLDTIRTANGRTIIFNYRRESLLTPMMPQEEIRIAHIADYGSCDVSSRSNYFSHSAANIIQSVPAEIIFPNGKVTFYSSQRSDIWRGTYLVYDDTSAPTKIDSIIVTNKMGMVIRRAVFYYHYAGSTSSPNTCRLILDSIGGLEPRAYKFTYYDQKLPKKNSRQIDMWGFYNKSKAQSIWSTTWSKDKIEEGTLMPSMIFDNRTFYGRNRQCNPQTITNATLKEVVYPTGGRSVFEYEPHTFPFINTDAEIIDNELVNKSTCLILNVDFTNGNRVSVSTRASATQVVIENDDDDINIHISSKALKKGPESPVGVANLIVSTDSGAVVFRQSIMLYSDEYEYDFHPILSAGSYNITLTYNGSSSIALPNPDNAKETSIYICEDVIHNRKYRKGNAINIGGGLRIKSITNYDISDSILQKKNYMYQLNDTVSSGRLFVAPRFAHTFLEEFLHKITPTIAPCGSYMCTLAASSMLVPAIPMVSSIVVGYNKVTEIITPESEYGRVEYVYQNLGANKPSEYPNFAAVSLPENGALLLHSIYNADGSLRQKKEYTYFYDWGKEIQGLHSIKLFPERYYKIATQQVDNVGVFKYTIRTYSPLQYIMKTTDFYDGKNMITYSEYRYDTINHIPKISSTYIDGDSITNTIVYSSCANSATATMLRNHHLYNKPLQQETYYNNKKTTTTEYLYEENCSNVVLKEVRQIKKYHNEDSVLMYSAKSYDTYGNPTCIIQQSHIPTAFVWGCNSMYPIIKVVGVEYEAIESALSPGFLNMLKSSCEVSVPMLKSVYHSLATAIPQGEIHIYAYLPYIGLANEIDARGIVYSYEYDDYHRLSAKYIETEVGKLIIEKYDYHFQSE